MNGVFGVNVLVLAGLRTIVLPPLVLGHAIMSLVLVMVFLMRLKNATQILFVQVVSSIKSDLFLLFLLKFMLDFYCYLFIYFFVFAAISSIVVFL